MKSPQPKITPARWMAYRVLADWEQGKGFAEDLLLEFQRESPILPRDFHLAQTLVFGILRRKLHLDTWIDEMAAKGIGSLPAPAIQILRLAYFQSAFLERVPPHAIGNESLLLCESLKLAGIKGLMNALIRRFPSRRAAMDEKIKSLPAANSLSIFSSHPVWLVEWAIQRFGMEKGSAWLHANNEEPRTFLHPMQARLLPEGGSISDAARKLIKAMGCGEMVEDGDAVLLPAGMDPAAVPAFKEGKATVQDIAAQQAVKLLAPSEGEFILDLCSAPGGKTIQIADMTLGKARILSIDSSRHRLRRVAENLQRCRFTNVETRTVNLLKPWSEAPTDADAVLLDVPCSGLGTLRRRVDLRYRLKPEDIAELAEKAMRLLETAAKMVKPGGRLVYSTCTLSREENESVIQAFIRSHAAEWDLQCGIYTPSFWGDESEAAPEKMPFHDASYCALMQRKT